MKKAVIFDLDGTLLDTLNDLANAVNHLLRSHSLPERSTKEIRSFLGNGARDLIIRSLPEKYSDEIFEEYLAEYIEYYNNHSAIETKPYDGVLELLELLQEKGIATAVVSNKPDAAVKDLCGKYFGRRIDFAIGDRQSVARKPAPDSVICAMNTLGCDQALYVGDSEVDVLTAKNAGIACVSMTWGFRDRDLLENWGATVFASNSDELKKAIFDHFGLEE